MVGRVFLFVGLILIAVGVYVAQSDIAVRINKQRADADTAATARCAIGGGVGQIISWLSDESLKTEIAPISDALSIIDAL